jgi:hypothetical protein
VLNKRLHAIVRVRNLTLIGIYRLHGWLTQMEASICTANVRRHSTGDQRCLHSGIRYLGPHRNSTFNLRILIDPTKSSAYLTAISTLSPSIPKGTYSQAIDSVG